MIEIFTAKIHVAIISTVLSSILADFGLKLCFCSDSTDNNNTCLDPAYFGGSVCIFHFFNIGFWFFCALALHFEIIIPSMKLNVCILSNIIGFIAITILSTYYTNICKSTDMDSWSWNNNTVTLLLFDDMNPHSIFQITRTLHGLWTCCYVMAICIIVFAKNQHLCFEDDRQENYRNMQQNN
jgi:hypothetical protein